MPVPGHVSGLVTVHAQGAAIDGAEVANRLSGSRRKRFRLNRKTPAHLEGYHVHTRPRVWKRLHFQGVCVSQTLIVRGGGTISRKVVTLMFFPGLVLVDLGLRRPTSPGLHG